MKGTAAGLVSLPTRVRKGVMVCLSPDPGRTATLLRKASRSANELDADLYAVYVETSVSPAQARENLERLLDTVMLAADLGAEVIWLRGSDVSRALLDFASDERITRIVIGRSRPGFGPRVGRHSVTKKMIERGRHFEVEVVGHSDRKMTR